MSVIGIISIILILGIGLVNRESERVKELDELVTIVGQQQASIEESKAHIESLNIKLEKEQARSQDLKSCLEEAEKEKKNSTVTELESKLKQALVKESKSEQEIKRLGKEIEEKNKQHKQAQETVNQQEKKLKELTDRGSNRKELGTFRVTAYCVCEECCEKPPSHPEYGITASGIRVQEGVTIAADWSVIPKGSKVFIEGVGERIVHDKGGAIKGNRIDVFLSSHEETKKFGVKQLKVWLR